MSMPAFPEFNPEMTRENAICMILTSIAMEELALSHIMNAEGEKLQATIKRFEQDKCNEYHIHELLEVNKSVTSLLDTVCQNQMLLKSKMDKALEALYWMYDEDDPCHKKPCRKCAASHTKCHDGIRYK